MTEEKKEDKLSQAPPPTVGIEKNEPKTEGREASRTDVKPKETDKKVIPAARKEKPSNCAGCNKSIKNKRWYYRNGKFYCSKKCWKSSLKKEALPQAA